MKKMMKKAIALAMLILPTVIQAQNELFSHQIGDFELTVLPESNKTGNASVLIGATPEMLADATTDGAFPSAINAFLLTTPSSNIVIDTGFGDVLFENLKQKSISADEVDVVLITHMHGDHVSGLLRDGKATFPKSTIYISKPEFEYWTNKSIMDKQPENKRGGFVLAQQIAETYGDKIVLFTPNDLDGKKQQLIDGVTPLAAYGHTPGHTVFLIESGNDKLIVWGDLVNSAAVQLPYPEVAAIYDVNPEQATETRLAIFKYMEDNHINAAGMHVGFPSMGEFEKGSGNHAYKLTLFK